MTYNFKMPLHIQNKIVKEMAIHTKIIADTAIYRVTGSLRIPNCIKI